jgi:hypothetical protein
MGLRTLRWLLSAGLLLSVSSAHGQSTNGAVTTAPNGIASVNSTFQFHSVFTHYLMFIEQPVLPWREANDAVGKIGGWRFYAKEASQPDAADTPTKSKPDPQMNQPAEPPSDAGSHSGHGRKP